MKWFPVGSWFGIYMPHQKGLGCWGMKIGTLYFDIRIDSNGGEFYQQWRHFRLYLNWFRRSRWTIGFNFIHKWRR